MWKGLFAIVLLALALAGCKMSNEALGREVMASMQETYDSDPKLSKYGLKYTDISVVQVQGNQYQGIATVTHEGEEHSVSVDIIYDGDTFIWSVQDGEFAFLAPVLFKDSYQEMLEEFSEAMHSTREILFPQETAPAPAATDTSSIVWSVQVGSYSSNATTDSMVNHLRAKGYQAYYKSTQGMNRVYVGPFDRPDAEATMSRLRMQEQLDPFVVRMTPD
jgi:hypothetical protein